MPNQICILIQYSLDHPFCITIDQEAQDYMGHMFGEINYTFINDVRKLPLRVPEINRMLTS
ncbi:MAG: hypothetical protein KKC76_00465 [Proteobacteria bacterium]|nr:hypothetical protein [Pseudomonadota bacterium]MBU4297006.1 hypothetical protein [Pseudomonadota bacterium]MCG2749887.1 hypothetical protein [Desulfobulbaceae bacterium]